MALSFSKRKAALRRKHSAKPGPKKGAGQAPKAVAKETSVVWSIRLPKSVDMALKRMARENGRSANKQVEMLIRKAASQSQEVAAKVNQPAETGHAHQSASDKA